MAESDRIVGLMSTPSTYRERPASVHMVETHISWVFLTDRYAYKLKKPVRFEFLDFSTRELRHRACLEELRLNRRLAPDVYLSVLPVTRGRGDALELDGGGAEVDWVVQMRRLPAARALDEVLRGGRLTAEDARAVTQHLVEFYSRLAPEPVAPDSYRKVLARHIRANGATLLDTLPPYEHVRIRRIVGAELRYLCVQAGVFDDRVVAGRIVDGHGDLRPEHIYLEQPPAVIDCLEFSEELRKVDVADELSFLAMECRRLGDGGFGPRVLAAYQEKCGDDVPEALLAFYCSYRACVRAKVAALRAQQEIEARRRPFACLARQYVDWADHNAAQLGRPALLIVGGLMGTGKSTLAKILADDFGAKLLTTDRVRRSLLGASPSPAGYGANNYQAELRHRVYGELFCQARELLDKGQSVILDGTFLSQELRQRAHELGRQHGAVSLHVLCQCPRKTALSRIQERASAGGGDSEARADLYDLQAGEFESVRAGDPVVPVDTGDPLARQIQTVCDELRHRLFG